MSSLIDPLVGFRPSSRSSRVRASHSYGVVLVLILASFLFAALAPDEGWATSLLAIAFAVTLVTALWTSGLQQFARASFVVVALVFVCSAGQLFYGADWLAGSIALLTAVLVVGTIAVVALGVIDQGEVNGQSVQGALCVYFLLGMMFVFVYGALAVLDDGPLFAQGTDGTRALRVYFSFVTLATLGYGDYTPSGDAGHTIAIVEALTGQLYLVVVVALLVSRVARRSEN